MLQMQPVAAQKNIEKKKRKTKKTEKKKPPKKQNCQRQTRHRLSIFKCVFAVSTICAYMYIYFFFAGSAAFGGQKIPPTDHCNGQQPTAAATSLHRHCNNFSFRFSRGACQKIKNKKKPPNGKRFLIGNQMEEVRYKHYGIGLVLGEVIGGVRDYKRGLREVLERFRRVFREF